MASLNAVTTPRDQLASQLANGYSAMQQQVDKLQSALEQQSVAKQKVTERLQTLLDLLPAGVIVLDNRGTVTDCNPAAIDFLGEPLIGQLWRDIIGRSFAPKLDDGHEISLQDGRLISLATRSFGDAGGQIILMTDMTETRYLQKNLSRQHRLMEVGRMMSSLAHQIRTPLSAAMIYAGHLCEGDLTPQQQQKFAGKIRSRLNHLEQQVKDMLIFVKGDVKLTEKITVAELAQQLELAVEAALSPDQYQLHTDNGDKTLSANIDTMVSALMNLINNAKQACGEDLRLSIRFVDQSNYLAIHITDNGPGMTAEQLAKLDEPFYTTKAQGTGLGIAVVKAVAAAHHGDFALYTQQGEGCDAVITLPILAIQ